jgi:DNA modification methylase
LTYEEFLQTKIVAATESGFAVTEDDLNPALLPLQRVAIPWACRGGNRAIFKKFGLGKSIDSLEFCRLAAQHANGWALIVLPLGVRQEFARDATQVLGWAKAPAYVRTMAEAKEAMLTWERDGKVYPRVIMTNYERVRDGDIEPRAFCACALDEASVLRSHSTKTNLVSLEKFRGVPYKLVCTATPDPNRTVELLQYAGFLEVAEVSQILQRFFLRNSEKAHQSMLNPSKEEEFWLWVSTWALFIQKPSDIGYDDAGYELPPMTVNYHELVSQTNRFSMENNGQVRMAMDATMSLVDAAREKRESIKARVAKAKEIVASDPAAHFILWHDLEEERREIKRQMPEAVEVYGTQDYDLRERNVIDFSEGRTRILATKKEISGSGCNFQRHCHRAIFVGIDFEFNDIVQAVHRIYRFLQTEHVTIDIIHMDTERHVIRTLRRKWADYDRQQERTTEILRKYGLGAKEAMERMKRSIGINRMEVSGNNYTVALNDTVAETAMMEKESVDMIMTSIPFSNLFAYSDSYNDFGHNEDTEKFFAQMDYLSPSLLNVLKPGRIFCCHVKDRVLFGNQTGTGMPTIEPFHALCIAHYMKHGFQYCGMITIVTDVVRENNQTYRLGWTEQCKDGTKMGVGCPEYLLLFRKLPSSTEKSYADVPVTKSKEVYTRARWQIDAHAYWRSNGDRLLRKDEIARLPAGDLQRAYRAYSRGTVYDYEDHVALAEKLDKDGKLPASFMLIGAGSWHEDVWDDIVRMRTLNTTQSQRRLQAHVCPLPIDIVERVVRRFTNEGETVYDPFGGLMTVPVVAVKMGRKGRAAEIHEGYFRDGVGYLEEADAARNMPTLFDYLNVTGKEDADEPYAKTAANGD